jgi:hypothetical protein
MTNSDGSEQPEPTSLSTTSQAEPTKAITIMLPESILKKLRVVAIVKETTVSDLVTDAATAVVRRELKKALSKISGESLSCVSL